MNEMSTWYGFIGGVVTLVLGVFVLYRLLVQQKECTIQNLKEQVERLKGDLADADQRADKKARKYAEEVEGRAEERLAELRRQADERVAEAERRADARVQEAHMSADHRLLEHLGSDRFQGVRGTTEALEYRLARMDALLEEIHSQQDLARGYKDKAAQAERERDRLREERDLLQAAKDEAEGRATEGEVGRAREVAEREARIAELERRLNDAETRREHYREAAEVVDEVRRQELDAGLHEAAAKGDVGEVRRLVEQGANVNASDAEGRTPLHWAAQGGSLDVARHLVEQGANVNAASGGRWTPLHYAARAGSLNVARYLVEQGANVNAAGADGRTPLRVAPNEETRASLRELGAKETGEEADGPRG